MKIELNQPNKSGSVRLIIIPNFDGLILIFFTSLDFRFGELVRFYPEPSITA